MSGRLATVIALSLACACTRNTGTLNLFPEAENASGGAPDGSPCANGTCATGGVGSGRAPGASGGVRNAPDAADCSTARDCRSGEASYCVAGRCVECRRDDDCTSGDGRYCSDNRCVECRSDDDCTPDKPGCVPSIGRCDDCSRDSQCEPGQRCNVDEGKCQ
jgi:hypothetical protein